MQDKTINGFELKRRLGIGGMAEVWYAENEIGMKAAVKILSEELSHNVQMKERFLNEAKVMVQLDHPNIRKVHGYGSIDGRPAIIMEYLDGSDLKARMKQGQHFTDEELKRWWNQIVDALNYTHAKDIVHRDIKPSNIFIDQKGNAKLLDFGIAKVADTTTGTLTGSTLGTRIYMSPEQVKDPKRVGTASDVYSLAVSFVHLLTGKAPYDSTTSSDYDIQVSIVTKPVDMGKVPEEWRSFLTPYLIKEADKRPALRHYELVNPEEKAANYTDDDTTLAEDEKQAEAKPVQKPKQKANTGQIPEPNDKRKSKKALWVALGAAAVTVLVMVLIMNSKDSDRPILVEETPFVEQPAIADGLTISVNGVNFTMKPVEGGTFQMGSNESYAESDDKPVHSVTVSSFHMGETEVTQALWKAVMGSNPSKWKGDNLPVEQVNWNDCKEFIRKLNGLTGRNFRLPTEAEWEFAARGGNKSNGYEYAGSSNIGGVAWYSDNSGRKTHTVKGMSPNELGLYDMSGNVWEWCSDWFGSYNSGSQTNPKGASSSTSRVLRGGGWHNNQWNCRVSYRASGEPDYRRGNIGFRLCLPVSEPDTESDSEMGNEQEDFNTGSLNGIFSVEDNKKVVFSNGNLQYQASTNT